MGSAPYLSRLAKEMAQKKVEENDHCNNYHLTPFFRKLHLTPRTAVASLPQDREVPFDNWLR
jgi:hypothetical protein